jgi:hypothetical protein
MSAPVSQFFSFSFIQLLSYFCPAVPHHDLAYAALTDEGGWQLIFVSYFVRVMEIDNRENVPGF